MSVEAVRDLCSRRMRASSQAHYSTAPPWVYSRAVSGHGLHERRLAFPLLRLRARDRNLPPNVVYIDAESEILPQ